MARKTLVEIGARIRGVRFRLDRSEPSFARLLGVDPETVRAWERGEAIDRGMLLQIAATTDTTMEWLLAGLNAPEVEAIRAAARARAAQFGPWAAEDVAHGTPVASARRTATASAKARRRL